MHCITTVRRFFKLSRYDNPRVYLNAFACISVLFCCNLTFSQSYKDDSLVVRAILDSNNLSTLKVTDVTLTDNNRITQIYILFERFYNLTSLIGKLDKLTTLYLSSTELTEIPKEIGKCTELEELSVTDNLLLTIPSSITSLNKLKIMDFSNNSLDTLPETIGNLTALDSLYLSGNTLIYLPNTIGTLKNLKVFRANGNGLMFLPDGLGQCIQLKTLGVEYNKLRTLPEAIVALKPTNFCDLGNNKLMNLPNAVVTWANTYDPDWKSSQDSMTSIMSPSIHLQKGETQHIFIHGNRISIMINNPSIVQLDLYTFKGSLVSTLFQGYLPKGLYSFNCERDLNRAQSMYVVSLSSGNKRMVKPFRTMK